MLCHMLSLLRGVRHFHCRKKVKMELKHLEDLDVIHQVRTPTDWCAPIAVVPKEKKRRYPVVCRPDKAG